jgi:hypothetical protein
MSELFRGMREDASSLPEIGASSRCLGVRPGFDVPATLPGDVVPAGQGGMSVSPDDLMSLPYFRRPASLGGTSRDPVWHLRETDLGPDLQYRPDPTHAGHGFLEPSRSMTLAECQQPLAQTQPLWRKVC